ncbi:MAG: citrate (Si)-synthase [Calditrichia bacterium]
MKTLKKRFSELVPKWRKDVQQMLTDHHDAVVSEVTVGQLIKGLRGVNAVLCDTSYVDAREGLFIRGIPVLDIVDRSGEEIFYLLCTGEFPDAGTLEHLREDITSRRDVPNYVWQMIDAMPDNSHPMTLLSMATLAMQRESVFVKRYREGMARDAYWDATLEDALTILARLPVIAAGIFRSKLQKQDKIATDPKLGFSENFAHMLGLGQHNETFESFIRQFVVVHSDHEGANASVLASRVVNSSLSDLYYSISGGMNCLAGPLHGLANQECLKFCMAIYKKFNGVPDDDALSSYIQQHLDERRVIPGFGHAVLREADPRFVAMYEFGKQVFPNGEMFAVVDALQRVVPPLLIKQGKAKNPYPNIDGVSGSMLYHYGMTELEFYTVMFSSAQILGICAQLVINRAIYSPLIRPKSVTLRWLQGHTVDHH